MTFPWSSVCYHTGISMVSCLLPYICFHGLQSVTILMFDSWTIMLYPSFMDHYVYPSCFLFYPLSSHDITKMPFICALCPFYILSHCTFPSTMPFLVLFCCLLCPVLQFVLFCNMSFSATFCMIDCPFKMISSAIVVHCNI